VRQVAQLSRKHDACIGNYGRSESASNIVLSDHLVAQEPGNIIQFPNRSIFNSNILLLILLIGGFQLSLVEFGFVFKCEACRNELVDDTVASQVHQVEVKHFEYLTLSLLQCLVSEPELARKDDVHDLHDSVLQLVEFACHQQTAHTYNFLIEALEYFSFIAMGVNFVHESDGVVSHVSALVDEGGDFEDAIDLLESLGAAREDAVGVEFQIFSFLSLVNFLFVFKHG